MRIKEGTVDVSVAGQSMSVYGARPADEGRHPAVVVLMEAFGLNSHIKNVASRFAGEGYVAMAPDLYHRQGGASAGYDDLPEAIRLMNQLQDDQILADIAAVVDHLQKQTFVSPERIGITGFCMGGRAAFLAACHNPAIRAAVPFYGGGIAAKPLEDADRLQVPLLLFFGGKDAFIPLEQVEQIKKRLADLGKQAETVVYPDADHGFFCDERPSYNAEAASDAWQRTVQFFARHLGE